MNEKYVSADIALAKADQLSKQERYEEAIDICDNVIANDENCYAAYSERSCSLHALGRFADALRDLEKLIELRTSSPNAHFRRARWLVEQGDYESALKDLYQVIHLEIEYFNESAYFYLAVALLNTNRNIDALQACERIPAGFREFISTPSTPGRLLSREQLKNLVLQDARI